MKFTDNLNEYHPLCTREEVQARVQLLGYSKGIATRVFFAAFRASENTEDASLYYRKYSSEQAVYSIPEMIDFDESADAIYDYSIVREVQVISIPNMVPLIPDFSRQRGMGKVVIEAAFELVESYSQLLVNSSQSGSA